MILLTDYLEKLKEICFLWNNISVRIFTWILRHRSPLLILRAQLD